MGCNPTKHAPSRPDVPGDHDSDTLSDTPVIPFEEGRKLAQTIGIELAEDQDSLFASNAWSPFEKSTGVCTYFDKVEGTFFNTVMDVMTAIDPPKFLIGRFEYREEILTIEPRYTIVGYVDRTTRLIRVGADNSLLAVAKFMGAKRASGEGELGEVADVGDEVSWQITGYKKGAMVGVFKVGCKKIGDVERFFLKA